MKNPKIELEPGEELLAVAFASFRGAAATSVRSTFALGSARMRKRAFDMWRDAAIASGFPTVPPDMVVAVSDKRVLFGKPTFLGRPPSRFWSAFDLDQVSEVVVLRHGLIVGVAFAFKHGAFVEIEAMRSRKLRRVAQLIEEQLRQ